MLLFFKQPNYNRVANYQFLKNLNPYFLTSNVIYLKVLIRRRIFYSVFYPGVFLRPVELIGQ